MANSGGVPERSRIPGTRFSVDAFRVKERPPSSSSSPWSFFLTHFHSDHYQGLTKDFDEGFIYCSDTTAKLMAVKFGDELVERRVRRLSMNEEVEIDAVGVTAIDANHCPGAVQLLFRVPVPEGGEGMEEKMGLGKEGKSKQKMKRYIHCGDCRFSTDWLDGEEKTSQLLLPFRNCDAVFLDTTYCHPKHVFPSQEESTRYIVEQVQKELKREDNIGIVLSTYVIGKEKIIYALLHHFPGMKIHVPQKKLDILQCYAGEEVLSRLTTCEAQVHIVEWGVIGETWPFFRPNFVEMEKLRKQMGVEKVIGFVPTGWVASASSSAATSKGARRKTRSATDDDDVGADDGSSLPGSSIRLKGSCVIHTVPYSEHSSYNELRQYVNFLKPRKIIPTVGEGARGGIHSKGRAKVLNYFRDLVDSGSAKRTFLAGMNGKCDEGEGKEEEEECICLHDGREGGGGGGGGGGGKNVRQDVKEEEEEVICVDDTPAKRSRGGDGGASAPLPDSSDIKILTDIVGCDEDLAKNLMQHTKGDLQLAVNAFLDNRSGAAKKALSSQKKGTTQTTLTSFFQLPGKKQGGDNEGKHDTSEERKKRPASPAAMRRVDFDPPPPPSKKQAKHEKEEDSLPYSLVAETLKLCNGTTKRLEIYSHLSSLFSAIVEKNKKDLLPALYLVLGKLGEHIQNDTPATHQLKKKELNIGGSIVSTAIATVAATTRGKIRELYREYGDLGDVAMVLKSRQQLLVRPTPLSIQKVYSFLHELADESGQGSGGRRQVLITAVLRACQGEETRFIVRTLIQNMRVGANSKSIVTALAYTFADCGTEETGNSSTSKAAAVTELSRTFALVPNFDVIVPSLLDVGLKKTIENVTLKAGICCKPMLAKVAHGIEDVVEAFFAPKKGSGKEEVDEEEERLDGEVRMLAEYKYDGMRAQIHITEGTMDVLIFSRNCDNITSRFPDVVSIFADMDLSDSDIGGTIFDAEIVALDRKSGLLRSFQELSSRSKGQSNDDQKNDNSVDVCVMLFDILSARNRCLVDMALEERRSMIPTILPNLQPGLIQMAQSKIFTNTAENNSMEELRGDIDAYFRTSLQEQCEGLVFKALTGSPDSHYTPDSRTSWMKLKQDYCESERETLDLVPIGAWYGNGRKKSWYSPFLLACYDEETESYQSVCRVMSGFSDEFYKSKTAFYKEHSLDGKPTYFETKEECSVWFDPCEVWEIVGADFSLSPVHKAACGLIEGGRGIGLRFPRFLRERTDKKTEEATDPDCIHNLFLSQSRRKQVEH